MSIQEMFALIQDQHDGKQCVFGKKLRPANDYNNEPDGIKEEREKFLYRPFSEIAERQRDGQSGQAHAYPAAKSRK